ncbi:MAG: laccase domain-containing protein, partial [Deltaproteobacteria bacterium]|nr:laccase domain-containing protein [Deltaproteobacteria bacterium]
MEIHRHKGLVYYSFEILSPYPHLKHGVFTRKAPAKLGGDLTFAFRPNLPVARVLTSLSLAQKALGLGPPAMVKQTHGTAIYLHDHNAPAYQPQSPDELLVGYDALVSEPKSSLLIKLADCQGILLFHPPSKVLALVH